MISPSLTQEVTSLHAEICSALADPNRILILYALGEKPCTVNELVSALNIGQPTVSRHLNILRKHGLVTSARDGQTVVNTLNDPRVIEALNLLRLVLKDSLKNQVNLVDQF
jgi:DNA-binding transcriptional ArsR family regulator